MSSVKAIYAGTAALGMRDDEERRAFYQRVTGKTRLREMTPGEKEAVVGELRRQGFKPKSGKVRLSGPYAAKLQALWISAWNLGLTRSRDDAALLAFVKRQTGIARVEFLREAPQATKVVEALKAMLARDGGVIWDPPAPVPAWLKEPAAKIALAQHARLHPDPEGNLADGFRAAVLPVVTPKRALEELHAADWRAVVQHFGALIRGAKARKGGAA